MNEISIPKISTIKFQNINLPASKSIANRLLILEFLYGQNFKIENLSNADDTQLLLTILKKIKNQKNKIYTFDLKNSGTTFRFLTALLSIIDGTFILTGSQRLKQRPILQLIKALKKLGAQIYFLEETNSLPIKIIGKKLNGGIITIDAHQSSQFVSALMMIAPKLNNGLKINISNLTSLSYIKMTYHLMKQLGFKFKTFNTKQIYIPKQNNFINGQYRIPPDWSSAAYWYALTSLFKNSKLLLKNLHIDKLQGDQQLIKIYKNLGVKTIKQNSGLLIKQYSEVQKYFTQNFSNIPDIAMPVIVNLCLLGIPFKISGLETLHLKESDRIVALIKNLQNLGYNITEKQYGTLTSKCTKENILSKKIISYNDHRIAMSFSIAAILTDLQISDYQSVEKSYPNYWREFFKTIK